jgi:hypothetical protein
MARLWAGFLIWQQKAAAFLLIPAFPWCYHSCIVSVSPVRHLTKYIVKSGYDATGIESRQM